MRDQGRVDCIGNGIASDRHGAGNGHSEFCIEHSARRSWHVRRGVEVIGLSLRPAKKAMRSTFRGHDATGMSGITSHGAGADPASNAYALSARGVEPGDSNCTGDAGDISVESSGNDYCVTRQPDGTGT